jgi:nucleoside-diphosphate-sugar epimerase
VEDSARALVAASESDVMIGQTANFGSSFEISIKELAHRIDHMAAQSSNNIQCTPERPGDVLRLCADSRKFNELCSWQPQVSFDTGLAMTIEFFRNHPLGLKGLLAGEAGRNWETTF